MQLTWVFVVRQQNFNIFVKELISHVNIYNDGMHLNYFLFSFQITLCFSSGGLATASINSEDESSLLVASFSEPHVSNNLASLSSPLFYGWFFNESTAESISIIGKKYFLSAYDQIPKFQQFVNQLMSQLNVTNPLEFYVKPVDPDTGKPDLTYHTTAKFCGRNDSTSDNSEECVQYLQQVGRYLGRPYRMHFVGLFFTNNTYGVRVKLTAEEQKLFREDTRDNSAQQSESELNNEIDRLPNEQHFSYEPYYFVPERADRRDNGPFYPGIQFQPQVQNFHPTESRAHVTLGCAPGIPAVQTGLDLINIIDLEVSSYATHEDFNIGGKDIPKAVLREWKAETEEGSYDVSAFVVYPEDEMVAEAVFDAYL